jgi:hypothetical protein
MKLSVLKKKLMKFFIIWSVCLSLTAGPAAGNEVTKMLECLSGAREAKMQELDAEEKDTGGVDKIHKKK